MTETPRMYYRSRTAQELERALRQHPYSPEPRTEYLMALIREALAEIERLTDIAEARQAAIDDMEDILSEQDQRISDLEALKDKARLAKPAARFDP